MSFLKFISSFILDFPIFKLFFRCFFIVFYVSSKFAICLSSSSTAVVDFRYSIAVHYFVCLHFILDISSFFLFVTSLSLLFYIVTSLLGCFQGMRWIVFFYWHNSFTSAVNHGVLFIWLRFTYLFPKAWLAVSVIFDVMIFHYISILSSILIGFCFIFCPSVLIQPFHTFIRQRLNADCFI